MEAWRIPPPIMNSLTEDLWTIILARLPLKSITSSKLVCKKWKSIVESPFLRELFLSRHQNSHSSWSLMCREFKKEVIAHYGCETWGLPRSLGSYISSFLTEQFKTQEDEDRPVWLPKQKVRVVAYTDVGLILIKLKSISGNLTYFVANPISRQCVETPPLPHLAPASFELCGLVTRIENGVDLVGYKVVLMDHRSDIVTSNVLRLLIFSSETGRWSYKHLHSPLPLQPFVNLDPVSLNGNLYWLGHRVVVSHDFYAATGTESGRCRVIPFPDSEKEPNFRRACTNSQGSLMYMSIASERMGYGHVEHKLTVWTLKSGEWQLVSEISPACMKTGFDYFPLGINPFDGNIMYLRSQMHKCLASTNLHKGKFGLHNDLERSGDGRTLSFAGDWDPEEAEPFFSTFVLPRWLCRIPSPPSWAR